MARRVGDKLVLAECAMLLQNAVRGPDDLDGRIVILDEITYPMTWGWIDTDEVVATIAGRPVHVNVVATGRDAPQPLIDVADTVTDMRMVKHAFQQGITAKKGIEY